MSQLKIDVEIMHPPALVWRALTEAKLLNEWFQPIAGWPESGARAGSRGRVFPTDDLRGFGTFDIDLVAAEPHSRLVARWQGEDFASEVTWEIKPIPSGGSRLVVRQAGFLGAQEIERRETLWLAYQTMVERLRATVGRLALGLGEGAFLAAEPPEEQAPRLRSHHRVRLVAISGVVLAAALCGTTGALWMNRDAPPVSAPPGGGATQPNLGSGVQPVASSSAVRSPAVVGTPSAKASVASTSAPPSAPGSAGPLAASYRTKALPAGLLGFDTEVTVRNPGEPARQGWTVVLTMPDATAVENRSAATVKVRQEGDVVTVTPVTATLAGGGSVTFTIRFPALLALAQSVKSCTIDGQACTAA